MKGEWKEFRNEHPELYTQRIVRYGDLEQQEIYLTLPKGKTRFPVVIWFHGGGMTGDFRECPSGFWNGEYGTAEVRYRTSGAAFKSTDSLDDAAKSTAFLLDHIQEYGGDPQCVFLGGMSAGAYLAAIYSDVSFAGTLDDPTVVGVSAANPELEDAVGAALETLRTSGLSVVARASWVGDLPDLSTDSRITGLAERVEEQEPSDDAEDEGEETEGEETEGEEAQTPEDQEGDSQVSDGQDDEAQDGEAQTPEGEEEPVQSDAM